MAAKSNPRLDRPVPIGLTAARPLLSPITVQIPDLSEVGIPQPPDASESRSVLSSPAVGRSDPASNSTSLETVAIPAESHAASPLPIETDPLATAGIEETQPAPASDQPTRPMFESVEQLLGDAPNGSAGTYSTKDRLLQIERDLRRERPPRTTAKRAKRGKIGRPQKTLLLAVLVLAIAGLTVWMLFAAIPEVPTQQPAWIGTNHDVDTPALAASDSHANPSSNIETFDGPQFEDISPIVPEDSPAERDELVGDGASLDPRSPVGPSPPAAAPIVRRLPSVNTTSLGADFEDPLNVPDPTPPPLETASSRLDSETFPGRDFTAGRLGLPNTDPRVANHDDN